MPNTTFWSWTFPDDNEEPYFEKFETFASSVDSAVYSILNTASNIIIPPASISWSPMTLSWSGEFKIPLLYCGYFLQIPFGPDGLTSSVTLSSGQRLYVEIPNTAGATVSTNMKVGTGRVVASDGLITIGYCVNSSFYANWARSI